LIRATLRSQARSGASTALVVEALSSRTTHIPYFARLMGRFLDLILAYKEYATLVLLCGLSLFLIGNSDAQDIRSLRSFFVAVVGAAQSTFAWIPNPVAERNENRALHELNLELAAEVGRLRQAGAENDRLRGLLTLKQQAGFRVLSAEVVGKTTTEARNTLTLNVGARDSVHVDMPIITDAGLVGRVIAVSDHFSLAQAVQNRDFRASAMIARTRVAGVLAWDAGEFAKLINVPKSYQVQTGDVIITSQSSNLYPPNIPIGTVLDVGDEPNSLFKRIAVKPAVDFPSLEHVFVVLSGANNERLELERTYRKQAEALAKGKKK
jgi:rod shape-determining protein MreC